MPELPEVEAVARSLRRLVRGQRILRCGVVHPIAVRPQTPAALRRGLEGQRIEEVERRGKHLLLRLSRGCLAMHFRLDGRLLWADSVCPFSPAAHLDVALQLEAGTLAFVDPRHIGRVQWLARPGESPGIRSLGVDPLSRGFTPGRFRALLAAARRPLKLLLLDQTRLAGLGNIYSCETLWQAQLDPRRRADHVAPRDARRLHKAIVNVLRRALECCLHPGPDFRDPDWWFAGLERILCVYGREGKRCRRCGSPIRRIIQGGRSTYCCAGCQR